MKNYDYGRDAMLARAVERHFEHEPVTVPSRRAGKCEDCGEYVSVRLPWSVAPGQDVYVCTKCNVRRSM